MQNDKTARPSHLSRRVAWPACVLAAFLMAAGSALAAESKQVLLLHSFGRDFAPFNTFSEAFRTELGQQMAGRVEFHDVALESAIFGEQALEEPLMDYLSALFRTRRLDLVVPIGGPAVRYAQKHRLRLFPTTPMLLACADQRHFQTAALTTNDAMVPLVHDPVGAVEDILQVLPQTTNMVVLLGKSPVEKFWVDELRRQFEPLTKRVSFVWFNGLSFAEIQKRAATLPPNSAVLYAIFSMDAEGVPYVQEQALARLHAVANAPIFGLYDSQMGLGIVGGRLIAVMDGGRNAAAVAVRILQGEPAGSIKTPVQGPERPVYDCRELKRWHISEARLPSGSMVRFRQPTAWEQYKWRIIGVISVCLLEGALIVLLVANLGKRRRAEQSLHELSGRLMRAQEDERARLARELHDDITQRLASLAIGAGRVERGPVDAALAETMREVRQELARLSEDVHALAYRLHPSVLEDLGLAEALRAEADRFTGHDSVPVEVKVRDLPESVPNDAALCLFRVAQEALRNAVRHAQARTVKILLHGMDGGLQLAVRDDGLGFNPVQRPERPSLGLASMRERVHLLGGELDVESAPGQGTTIVAWVPVAKTEG